ncbi:gas vesicle protein GvpH [Halococcus sediminicola]|uniref:gas vesicle protein GvpH n=1 Tax=Halococcus sediminicola TaxID=1264579 RepID=UPI0006784E25|nr:gas vesicle protein GvpH [Halococcus sediminicola]
MTSDDRTENDDGSKTGRFIHTVLTDVFETLADMDEGKRRRGVGSTREGRTRFDYGFDVGIGPGTDGASQRRLEKPDPDADSVAVVQPTDGGYVVTLDLPDVDPHELSAGVDDKQTLVVADDGGVVGRVSLPQENLEVGDASYNNGVLNVRLDATGSEK